MDTSKMCGLGLDPDNKPNVVNTKFNFDLLSASGAQIKPSNKPNCREKLRIAHLKDNIEYMKKLDIQDEEN